MIRPTKRSLLALLLALTMMFAIACEGREPAPSGDADSEPSSALPGVPGFVNPMPVPDGPGQIPTKLVAYSEKAVEKHGINEDTVGWLHVPNTSIDDVVMWYPNDYNDYYLRKDFYKRYSWEGSYFADFRCTWGEGRKGMAKNTVIYGHSMEDDANKPLFSQLKKFLDIDFAKENPYIYFSTIDEDMVWEIFAVYYSTIHEPYNTPDPDDATFAAIIKDAQERSIYIYDADVKTTDKVITFSTCCYNYESSYPNQYRYVIMAKLADENATLNDTASLTKNPNPKQPK